MASAKKPGTGPTLTRDGFSLPVALRFTTKERRHLAAIRSLVLLLTR
jgi:hypothetical protein